MPFPATSDENQIDTFQPKKEPSSSEWWTTWNKGNKCLRDIVDLFEEGDDSMNWTPAKTWISKDKDRNYQYLCQYYVVIHLQNLDKSRKFISAPLRAVKIFSYASVPKNLTIVEVGKNECFIDSIKI